MENRKDSQKEMSLLKEWYENGKQINNEYYLWDLYK